ncbi:MAG: insulinase family protein [Acinetobacter sp.]|nr:insulinase family protein [Acinetobacter sp.]
MKLKLKTLTVSLLALGLSSTVFAKPILQQSYKQIEEYKLDNGLKVILFENNKESKVYMNMIYQTGSLNDPHGKGGMAHLLEHLAFKGTKNTKGDDFQKRLDQYTLTNNASTDYYVTQYTNEVRAEKTAVDEVLRLEAERMDKLVLQQKFVPAEIEIVKRERELTSDQPFAILIDHVFKGIYGNKDLGREPIGDLEELESINMDELNEFYRKWYAPNNATFVISGKFDKASLLKSLDQKFSSIPARKVPEQAVVPDIDLTKVKGQTFSVQKGSSYQKMNLYMTPRNPKTEPVLEIAPLLFDMEPSGHLYKKMVDTGIVDEAMLSPWNTKNFNLMIVSADYSPSQNVKKIDKELISSMESFQPFTDVELNRVKTLFKNGTEANFKDASQMGDVLSQSIALNNGDWLQFFKNREAIQTLDANGVNQQLKTYFKPVNRIHTEITPAPVSDSAKQKDAANITLQTLKEDSEEKPEPFKNVDVYKRESAAHLKSIKDVLTASERKVQSGSLNNGLKYKIYSAETSDDMAYGTFVINFGTKESTQNQKQIIEFVSYLMARGTKDQSLQDIADRGIEANGEFLIFPDANSIEVKVSADHDKFLDYFAYVIDVIQKPLLDKEQFDLIKTRSLNQIKKDNKSPDMVAQLKINELTNHYSEGDLRYKPSPTLLEKQVKAVTLNKVRDFYKNNVSASQGQIVLTGKFDKDQAKQILQNKLSNWNSNNEFRLIENDYVPSKAQSHYLFAEPREFGTYQSFIDVPLSKQSEDAPAMWIMSYILGESQLSSRLGKELREKNGLVYVFNFGLDLNQVNEAGRIGIETNYTAGNGKLISQAIHKVLNDVLKNGVTEQEVEFAKAGLLQQDATRYEIDLAMHDLFAKQLKFNQDMKYQIDKSQQLANVTKADVDAVIKKYIKLDQFVEVMADQYGK